MSQSTAPTKTVPVVARASFRDDVVTVAAGTWMVLALFADGWAHQNVPGLDTFFTPWHLALYSGFLAAAAWVGVLALRRRRPGQVGRRSPWELSRSLPAGYPLAAAGVLVFGAGGVLDLLWHTAFGVEVGIDALLSPSHLILLAGALLLLTAPVRAAWLSSAELPARFRVRLPELLSLTLTTGLVAFFLIYVSAFLRPGVNEAFVNVPEGAAGHEEAQLPAIATLGAYLLTTALIVVPLLLLARRALFPRGAATLLIGTVVWLSAGLQEFARLELPIAATIAAVVVDVVLVRLDRIRGLDARARLPLVGALIPAVLWPAQLAAIASTDAIRYPIALWTGVVVLSVFLGGMLGILAAPPRLPAGSGERQVTVPVALPSSQI